MNNSIDVHHIASEIFREIENRTEKDFESLLQECNGAENKTHRDALLFHGILDISKKHSERFAVALVQKVVDELKTSSDVTL